MCKSDESYFEIIERCAKEKSDTPIQNGEAKHASYLMKTFFKYAESNVSIFTGSLFTGVFDDENLRNEAIKFLQKGSDKKLVIAYNEDAPSGRLLAEPFLESINKSEKKGTVEVWKVGPGFTSQSNHFAVMDRSAFRFEVNHEAKQATANFGDKKSAETLAGIFDTILSKSAKVFPAN